ncbi:hypothetical protein R3Q06_31515 [Rhodococcus erythropolis]|uniref:hypothetical protein n=1 Tax=Rhodococcus erythropolis TaxID=1833 RepID=UPI002949E536|nr:hypothetical protein [Rhodococcus erythropolis]MDV6278015.1 hypothetical protein [Rhodococcus erythropolis]
MSLTASSNHLRRVRRWVYTPMVAAVAAGAVCTGVGIGSAVADTPPAGAVPTGSAAAADTLQSGGSSYIWSLTNNTAQPVYGQWTLTDGQGQTSGMAAAQESPLTPGARLSEMQKEPDRTARPIRYATGKICYNHTWWNWSAGSERSTPLSADARDFVLTTDPRTGTLSVSYQGFNTQTDNISDSGTPC